MIDVLIVGGGIAGASLGAEIAGAVKTVLVEAESLCGVHSTGRSAAFWLESYGGPEVAHLSRASHGLLAAPPADFAETAFLTRRGAIHLDSSGASTAFDSLPESVATRPLDRGELEALIPGLRPQWRSGRLEDGCADIDVAALHGAYLRQFRRRGGEIRTGAGLVSARSAGGRWIISLSDGSQLAAATIVNAAGAWADGVAVAAGIAPIGIMPKRRTMVQLRVGQGGLRAMPLVIDSAGQFYFKGEGDRTIWLSPHDEIDAAAGDANPDELDVATAIDRFEQVVDWPVEAVERSWAGLRSFAPDRLPLFGFDPAQPGFFWCAGQGGFGIQTAPAAARLAAALLLGTTPDDSVAAIDPATFSPARFA